jgi:hypothetical protein
LSPSIYLLLERIRAAGFDGVEVPMYKGRDFATAALRQGLAEHRWNAPSAPFSSIGMSLISEDKAHPCQSNRPAARKHR